MTLRNSLLAATLLALPVVAQAQPVSGIYIGGGAGYDYLHDFKATGTVLGGSAIGRFTGSGGPVGVISVGYGFGNGLRVEVEGNGRYEHERAKNAGVGGGLNLGTYGGMGNVLYDFNLGWVMPYIGAGAGYEVGQVNSTSVYTNPGVIPAGAAKLNNSSQGNFATQGIAGVAFPIAGVPGLALTAEYRFMAVLGNNKINGLSTVGVGAAAVTAPASLRLNNQYHSSGLIGFRYAFGAPAMMAPAPVPVAVAPASRSYLVFFDWDKSDLSARARQIIAEAAQASTRTAVTRIDVGGNADRSGTPAYNLGLSRRRADTVAAELVRDGVPKASIAIMAYGDTRPLVPTAAGVREPQNRRVEIVLR